MAQTARLARAASRFVSPIAPGSSFEGVDQGVDYNQQSPYRAVGSGTVYALGSGWHGGTGQAVYEQLDQPLVVNGHSYPQVYYAETSPLVKVGDKVAAGQPVASGGGAELGFASGASPMAPLAGGYNAEGGHTVSTQQGYDLLSLIRGQPPIAAAPPLASAATGSPQPAAQTTQQQPSLAHAAAAQPPPGFAAAAQQQPNIRAFAQTLLGGISPTGQIDQQGLLAALLARRS